MSELIEPNAHVALVHFPIALLVVGVLLEFFSFLGWRHSSLRSAARWMILLGAMLGVPTALGGVFALHDVFAASPESEEIRGHFRDHIIFSSIAVLAALLIVTVWIGSSDRVRGMLHWPAMIGLLMSVGMTTFSANVGGHMVYAHAVGVAEQTQPTDGAGPQSVAAEAAEPTSTTQRMTTQDTASSAESTDLQATVAAAAPPLQTHVIFAGLSFAFAVVSLGISSRAMMERQFLRETNSLGASRSDGDVIASTSARAVSPVEAYEKISSAEALTQLDGVRPGPIAWLATLFAGIAAVVGYWYLARESDVWTINELWKLVTDRSMNDGRWLTRRLAHVVSGVSIAVLPLVVLAVAGIMPRARIVWALLSLLLMAAISAQVWLGVLMIFDETGAGGPVTQWSRE